MILASYIRNGFQGLMFLFSWIGRIAIFPFVAVFCLIFGLITLSILYWLEGEEPEEAKYWYY